FGSERVACVAMTDTYRVRHAIRDVGAAMSLPPGDIDAIAKAFPHIRARDARAALRDLPELRRANLADAELRVLFEIVEKLDGLPRHVALHPCGVLLSDATLLDRTPVEASFGGYPMSQFDKDDVEDLGLLKLDILGIRMQSSMAHALDEIERVEGTRIDLEALAPFEDVDTYAMISRTETIGCFQIESPGQRELVGKFGPRTFEDLIVDISLFRPGPVKSDMVVPFLRFRNGWSGSTVLHPNFEPALAETGGVVVFHEQVIKLVAAITGCSLAYGDEARRALGDLQGQADVKRWLYPAARGLGYDEKLIDHIWEVLVSFASFGFCKAHAAAFALPTYQSAWLKAHYPAHFLAGLLTHDPGMYPKRLILEEARRIGVTVLGLDVNRSDVTYRVERVPGSPAARALGPDVGDADRGGRAAGRRWWASLPPRAIRLALSEVRGIDAAELERVVAGQPYTGLTDFWHRAQVSVDVVERLILVGAFDELYGVGEPASVQAVGTVTRRDLLLALADLARADRIDQRARSRARGLGRRRSAQAPGRPAGPVGKQSVQGALDFTEPEPEPVPAPRAAGGDGSGTPRDVTITGLPEMTAEERMAAELEVIGLDATKHVLSDHLEFLRSIGVTFSHDLLERRSGSSLLVAGVKVATQTPPVKSGKRVIFLTLDDTTGPVDLTFFEDAQGEYATTVFSSWLIIGRGELRRTGPRGVSLRATGAWDFLHLRQVWQQALEATGDEERAVAAVAAIMRSTPAPASGRQGQDAPGHEADAQPWNEGPVADAQRHAPAGGMGRRRVLVHPSGFVQSPYTDIAPSGESPKAVPRKMWHSSPGSSGW
ncbi:MAG: OB-fold nucleic acid binding domain-containing protein, partial [Actinomycetes bacterium]